MGKFRKKPITIEAEKFVHPTQHCGDCYYYRSACYRFPDSPGMTPYQWCGEWKSTFKERDDD